MKNKVKKRLQILRELMAEKNIDAYIIPSADNHQSEYVGEYFKARAFMTGFTGTAGTAVILKDKAGLWTDGRYFIQAEKQLEGTGIELFRIGNPGVLTIAEYLDKELPKFGKLGFDGRLISLMEGENYLRRLAHKNESVEYEFDLVDEVWTDRPTLPKEPVFILEEKYSGESRSSKLNRVREVMISAGANQHVLTTLDDIAWLLNIRGNDVMYSPLVLSYAVINLKEVHLFIDIEKMDENVKKELQNDGVIFHSYNDVYSFVKELTEDDSVMIDPNRINYALYLNLPARCKKIERENPEILFKAIKNPVELANIEKAHIKDGVAQTKLMHWIKTNVGKMKITELSTAEKLEEFRKEQDGYLWQSFAPICAFKENAAMMHYSSTEESNATLTEGSLMLTDTGGNYFEGTTDITRTIALGEVSDELKKHFTAVARGMMNLARAKFLYGCRGYNLDILARGPIWDLDIDYKSGTGHGVGYLLNIHEGPAGFRWYTMPGRNENHILEEGMVITDEPGIYIAESHGIRLENELIIKRGVTNEYGTFMYFEPVTYAPIDLDAIIVEDLNADEKEYLNSYHEKVFEKLSPHLPEDMQIWLKYYTRKI